MDPHLQVTEIFTRHKVCVIIPSFNNGKTITKVVRKVLEYTGDIIVVNDGSTDETDTILRDIKGIRLLSYPANKGKGYALRKGFELAIELGFDYAATLDADDQHFVEDLSRLAVQLDESPDSLIIGARNIQAEGMPGKNTFANKFSNFWFWAETGLKLPDTQSGFRIYPVKLYKNTRFFTNRYEFEIEVLVRSAWSGIKINSVPVRVRYPEDRVTHFRPLKDFTRISILNTVLVLITFLYIVPRNTIRYFRIKKFTDIVREQLRLHNDNPAKTASAIGFGIFMGIVPVWGFQMLTAAFLAHFLRLNKVLVLAASNISIPPIIPFIIYFSYLTGGAVLGSHSEITLETLSNLKQQVMSGDFYATFNELGYSIYQYVTGSIVFGLLSGTAAFLITYLLLRVFRPKSRQQS